MPERLQLRTEHLLSDRPLSTAVRVCFDRGLVHVAGGRGSTSWPRTSSWWLRLLARFSTGWTRTQPSRRRGRSACHSHNANGPRVYGCGGSCKSSASVIALRCGLRLQASDKETFYTSLMSGSAAREAKKRKGAEDAFAKDMKMMTTVKEAQAAARIQSMLRKRRAKRELENKREAKQQGGMAVLIQARYRARLARRHQVRALAPGGAPASVAVPITAR